VQGSPVTRPSPEAVQPQARGVSAYPPSTVSPWLSGMAKVVAGEGGRQGGTTSPPHPDRPSRRSAMFCKVWTPGGWFPQSHLRLRVETGLLLLSSVCINESEAAEGGSTRTQHRPPCLPGANPTGRRRRPAPRWHLRGRPVLPQRRCAGRLAVSVVAPRCASFLARWMPYAARSIWCRACSSSPVPAVAHTSAVRSRTSSRSSP